MNIANSLEQIRKHPKLYLGEVEPNGILLAARLAESALISRALLVELRVLDAPQTIVEALGQPTSQCNVAGDGCVRAPHTDYRERAFPKEKPPCGTNEAGRSLI